MDPLRIAVLGHVEHITLGRVPSLPGPGDIAHLEDVIEFPGGGGGVAFSQLTKGSARVHLYTAVGNDEAGRFVRERLMQTGAELQIAARDEPHTRDVVLIPPQGDRTIMVVGAPLHPSADDGLDFSALPLCAAAYFTAQDPRLLRLARGARCLVVSARRREALNASGVKADVVVGSVRDPRERSTLADYAVPPHALVLTEGEKGGAVHTARGELRFPAPALEGPVHSAYGAGDSFAGALTYFMAKGLDPLAAATRAAAFGAAVLQGFHPLQGQRQLPE